MDEKLSGIPVLSVIMPVYNEAEYLPFALESVLMQQTDFPFEILVVDDCSTDDTPAIAEHYRLQHPQIIRYLRNPENKGNAYAFWNGLRHARGDFFQVLDGDDFFLLPHKLQRQIDFLRANPSYAAAATNSLRLLPDGRFHPEAEAGGGDRDYHYHEVLRCSFYLHTSAYVYRNVFKGSVPGFLQEEWARGDSIRTMLVAKHGKVRYLDFIASVYRFHSAGIWSSMTERERQRRVVRVFSIIRDRLLQTPQEKAILTTTIRHCADLAEKSKTGVVISLCLSPRRLISKLRQPGLRGRLRRLLTGSPATFTVANMLERLVHSPARRWCLPWYHRLQSQDLCMAMGRLYLARLGYDTRAVRFSPQTAVSLANAPAKSMEQEEALNAEGWQVIRLPDADSPASDQPYARMEYLIGRMLALHPERLLLAPSSTRDIGLMAAAQPGLATHLQPLHSND